MTELCCKNKVEDLKCSIENLDHDFHEILKDFPQVLLYINRLLSIINHQCKNFDLLSKTKEKRDAQTQTEGSEETRLDNETKPSLNIVDEVRNAAEDALKQTGFVYEPTSGMYYDYKTGYYYNAEAGLYYDGNKGTYLYYDQETKEYKFHSQIQTENSENVRAENTEQKQEEVPEVKRKGKKKIKTKKKRIKTEKEESDVEDGELSSSSCSSSTTSQSELSDELINSHDGNNEESGRGWPPCMRIIVDETNLDKLKVGTLFVVTYMGGTVGREMSSDHAVTIPDVNISKYHARIHFDTTANKYMVTDLGSRNGTLLNGTRLSVALRESDAFTVEHGSVLQLGSTRLVCHVHNGRETCGKCEPGLVQTQSVPDRLYKCDSKTRQHKSQLLMLKKKFGVDKVAGSVGVVYEDRAELRRIAVGSTHDSEKTDTACVNESIKSTNKGFKMLAKMGWSEGQSLGKVGDGLTEPVPLVSNEGKAGLGSCNIADVPPVDKQTRRKQNVWKKTQQRYSEIQPSAVDKDEDNDE